jgi:hypothetical protein
MRGWPGGGAMSLTLWRASPPWSSRTIPAKTPDSECRLAVGSVDLAPWAAQLTSVISTTGRPHSITDRPASPALRPALMSAPPPKSNAAPFEATQLAVVG